MRAWIALALLVASAACDSPVCHCPAAGCDTCSTEITAGVPVNSLAVVSSATTNAPCTTKHDDHTVSVSIVGAGTCDIHVQFADGGGEAVQIRFDKVQGACGCYITAVVTSVEQMDAGSG